MQVGPIVGEGVYAYENPNTNVLRRQLYVDISTICPIMNFEPNKLLF